MKKWIVGFVSVVFAVSICRAGLITHTDYLPNGIITATGQNTNENTIITEFNGNIESNNIKDGTITTSDISVSAGITSGQLSTSVQNQLTAVNGLAGYRKPVMTWIDRDTIDVEGNTGTLNQTCVQFPDERRCVTENTASTSVNRRIIMSETASLSGTKNSGLRSGLSLTNDFWYSFYAVKTTDVSTDFVIVADTIVPSQVTYASLNTNFATNGWVYLGVKPRGNNGDNRNSLVAFYQIGAYTVLVSTVQNATSQTANPRSASGVLVSSAASLGSGILSWTYAAGSTLSSGQVPAQIALVDAQCTSSNTAGSCYISGNTNGTNVGGAKISLTVSTDVQNPVTVYNVPLKNGLSSFASGGSAVSTTIGINGYWDSSLTGGFASPF